VATYRQLPSNGFVMFDDDLYVTANAHVQRGLGWENFRWAFTTTEAANWHPLTWLSHMLDVQLFGLDAGRHHLTSLVIHAGNALLILLFLLRLTGSLWRSAAVSALFALHPLHVESVAWVAERKDLLSTLFGMLTLLAWLGWVRSRRRSLFALALLSFALGLMAKPMLVTLPFVLLLLDFWPLRRLPPPGVPGEAVRRLLLEKGPFFLLAAASSVVTLLAQKAGGTVQTLTQLSFAERVMNAAEAYVAYLGKTLWPVSLAIFYPHPRAALSAVTATLSFLALVGLTALVLRLRTTAPCLLFGWLWYLGTLVPVIGLVQVGEQSMADRYTYVPLLGIFVAAVWGLADLVRSNRTARAAVVALSIGSIATLGVLCHAQVGVWKDSETLFRHALAVTGPNSLARNNYGLVLYGEGRAEEALVHLEEAIRIDPDYPDAHNNYGIALAKLERWDLAVAQYETALRLEPGAPSALVNLGNALLHLGRIREAESCFREVLSKNPESADARLGLGSVLGRQDRPAEALEQLELASRRTSRSAATLTARGELLGRLGRVAEAMECLQEAVKIDPNHVEARINLGVALDRTNRIPEAIEQFRQAVRIKPNSAEALDGLGLCLGRLNRIPEATERFREAVVIAPESADVRSHLGIALARGGRLAEAEEQFREVLRLRPDDATARATLEKLLRARRGSR
jgi:tetratricopeptide (TPR) repeat protein